MKATITYTVELNDKQLKRLMEYQGYDKDFEPIEAREELEGWDLHDLKKYSGYSDVYPEVIIEEA